MSSINPNNIDGTYPIAGQDNDSQGFRDNFTNIKNNFTFAYDELTDLQSKAVLKSALTGGSLNNDMNYNQLISAQLLKTVETVNNLGTKTGSFTISWADGHFQYYTTSGDTILAFSNWPTSAFYTKLRLQITTDTTNRTVTFPPAVSVGLSDIQGAASQVVTLPTAGVYLFELTTLDNGSTITIQDLLRNYDIVTTGSSGAFTSLNVSGNVLATGLSVFGNTTLGKVGTVSGQFHSVVGNITQTTSGGAVYINTTGNLLATGLRVFGNTTLGNVGTVSGQFHSVIGNITQTSSGGAVYINTTGNVLAASVTTGALVSNGNISVGLAGAVSGQFHTIVGNITQTSSGGAVYINTTGNVLAAGGILNALTVNGTTTRAGATVDTGYQFYQPSANVFVQANVDVSRVILAPIGTALVSFSANVTLPNITVDGTVVSISSNSAVQFFSVMAPYPDSGRKLTPQGNVALAAGDKAEYLYRSADNTWYKVG